jgi:hypothetical protein
VILASLACGLVALLIRTVIPGSGSVVLFLRLAVGGGAGMLVYLALTRLLRVEEVAKVEFLVRNALQTRLSRWQSNPFRQN